MEILGKILGTSARVKIMRLFLLNRGKGFTSKDIMTRSRVTPELARKELRLLTGAGFLKKRGDAWIFNNDFKYEEELSGLLINADSIDADGIVKIFKSAGRLRLVIISGIFIKNKDARVDILIVGDKIKRGRVEEGIRKLEAEMGAELTYAVFETKEFHYRISMYDKLVRDILDFPHKVLLQTKDLNLSATPGQA